MRALANSRLFRWSMTVVVLAAATLVAVDLAQGPATYPLTAVFAKAPGLFPGAAVDVLGVPVGTVGSVHNVGNTVVVGMAVDRGSAVPANATASLVSPELLGEPDIELGPGYTSGLRLRPGTTIPESRTAVPVSTDQLLRQLDRTLKALNPHAVGDLISNLADDLNGQGQSLNQLIASAAGTIQLLADKGDDLGQLDGSLAQLTGTLDTRTSEISSLITEYDTVSGVVAQHNNQLSDAISQLSGASTQIVALLSPNLAPLEQDVGTITTTGRTVDRNISNVDEILSQAVLLFTAAQRAYDPSENWLNLNNQLPTGVTGAYVAGLVRDDLAGICRRITANHSAGLSAGELQTLQTCGNPGSGFFNPILDQIPTILDSLPGGTSTASLPSSTSASSLLQQGLATIPGLSQATGPSTSVPSTSGSAPATPPATTAPATPPATPAAPPTTTTTAPPTTTTTSPGTCNGLLSVVICPSGSSGSSSSSGGLGGLLSASPGSSTSAASAASATDSTSTGQAAPSLTAAAAKLLPPLRRSGGHHRTSGVMATIDRMGHDMAAWL